MIMLSGNGPIASFAPIYEVWCKRRSAGDDGIGIGGREREGGRRCRRSRDVNALSTDVPVRAVSARAIVRFAINSYPL